MSQTPQQFLAEVLPEYGFLLHEKALCEARGLTLPTKSVQDLQEVEGWIYNNVPPQVAKVAYDKAMHHAESFRRQFNGMQEEKQAQEMLRDVDSAAAKMTEDFASGPLSPEGRKAVADGKPVSLSTGKMNFDKPMWNQIAKKVGYKDYKELFKAQDDLVELKQADPVRYKERLKTLNDQGKDIGDQDVDVWGKQGTGLVVGLMERMEERDKDMPHREVYEASEREQRKAQTQDAWMDHTETPPVDTVEEIHQDYLENEHMTGDIARAFVANETQGDA